MLARIGVSALVAGGLTALLAANIERPGKHWFVVLLLVPLLLSMLASDQVHQPSEVVFWVTEFLQLFAIAYLAVTLAERWLRGREQSARRE